MSVWVWYILIGVYKCVYKHEDECEFMCLFMYVYEHVLFVSMYGCEYCDYVGVYINVY